MSVESPPGDYRMHDDGADDLFGEQEEDECVWRFSPELHLIRSRPGHGSDRLPSEERAQRQHLEYNERETSPQEGRQALVETPLEIVNLPQPKSTSGEVRDARTFLFVFQLPRFRNGSSAFLNSLAWSRSPSLPTHMRRPSYRPTNQQCH